MIEAQWGIVGAPSSQQDFPGHESANRCVPFMNGCSAAEQTPESVRLSEATSESDVGNVSEARVINAVILSEAKNLGSHSQSVRSCTEITEMFRFAQHDNAIYEMRSEASYDS